MAERFVTPAVHLGATSALALQAVRNGNSKPRNATESSVPTPNTQP
jgi:hypothetical protein